MLCDFDDPQKSDLGLMVLMVHYYCVVDSFRFLESLIMTLMINSRFTIDCNLRDPLFLDHVLAL